MARRVNRNWWQRLGLAAQSPRPDEWVAIDRASVGRALASVDAAESVQILGDAGIEARAERYVRPDRNGVGSSSRTARERIDVAVLVRRRDRARAIEVLRAGPGEPVSDEELMRQAEEAGPPPDG